MGKMNPTDFIKRSKSKVTFLFYHYGEFVRWNVRAFMFWEHSTGQMLGIADQVGIADPIGDP